MSKTTNGIDNQQKNWTTKETIFVLNRQSNVLPEVIFECESSSTNQMCQFYTNHFKQLKSALEEHNINYLELKRGLLPPEINKNEAAFIFDSNKMNPYDNYTSEVLKCILPVISQFKKSTFTIMCGDLPYHPIIPRILDSELNYRNNNDKLGNSNYFSIYINNLTEAQFLKIHQEFSSKPFFSGSCTFKTQLCLKTILSRSLVQIALVHNMTAIVESSEDDSETTNNPFIDIISPFCTVVLIEPQLYGTFLTYRIITTIFDNKDVDLSLNSLYPIKNKVDVSNIIISPEKIEYLKDKGGLYNHGKHAMWSNFFKTEDYDEKMFQKLIA